MENVLIPKIYQHNETFFNCYDYPICLYLTNNNLPYQYIYADNWRFHYKSVNELTSIDPDMNGLPKFTMLQKVYNVKRIELKYETLMDLVQKEKDYIFIHSDGWYLPWTLNYQREHESHWSVIVDSNSYKVQIIDKIPEHNAWEDINVVNQGYTHGGSKAYKLTSPPYLKMDTEKAENLIHLGFSNIIGTTPKEGLNGLKAFRKEMTNLC